MRGYELSDFEWRVIAPLLPNKPRGVPRVNDRRVLNGIFWVLRTGAPWRALPKEFGPQTTCYNRFVRWRRAGVWDRILAAVTTAYDGNVQMIDSTSVRVHQHVCGPGMRWCGLMMKGVGSFVQASQMAWNGVRQRSDLRCLARL